MKPRIEELDTPSLLVDLDVMEDNLQRMQTFIDGTAIALRPHTKAHKIPDLAKQQVALGAQGICVAKLGEAEVMVAAGLDDVLITTPIANPIKIARLVALKRAFPAARIVQVIDSVVHARGISEAASIAGVEIDLLIEVECGQKRCGLTPGIELVQLIDLIIDLPAVNYAGLQAYTGHIQLVANYEERNRFARDLVVPVFEFIAKELKDSIRSPEIVSGGGTGTYSSYDGFPFTELQAGSYIFMDWNYHTIGSKDGSATYNDFACALKVWTTVVSKPTETRAVVDAGMKSLSIDSGMPQVEGLRGVEYSSGGDEHGILTLTPTAPSLEIGQRIKIIPSHCDTTLTQFNKLYGMRGSMVEQEWEIAARGRSD
jgi:3-hydroxy-D-aspartate aldolase